jgi:hypothetical protein
MIDAAALSTPSQVRVTLLDDQGAEIATRVFELDTFEPFLRSIDHAAVFGSDLADFNYGTLHCEVISGAVIFAASKVDNDQATGDPTTLAAWSTECQNLPTEPGSDAYLFAANGEDDIASEISDWDSLSTLTEVAMDGYDRVMQVDPGRGWAGGLSSCIAFMGIGDYQTAFDAIKFKIKSDDLSAIYVKVPEIEFAFPFADGTDLGNGWFEITAPFDMFTGSVPGTDQIGIHGGWDVGGTFFITDVALTADE